VEVAPRHMVPRYVEIVPRLPKTPTEKVEKFRLKAEPFTPSTWDSDRPAARQPG
jgi:carnitine-CoA ligase